MTFCYFAYGLRIAADRPIPGLLASDPRSLPDVKISLGVFPSWFDSTGHVGQDSVYTRHYTDDDALYSVKISEVTGRDFLRFGYPDHTEFLIDRYATEVWVRWPSSMVLDDAAAYLLGPVLGFVLRLRGVTTMHASAVCVDGKAIAFVGPQGAGKSTTAAALLSRGCPVITDDVLAMHEHASEVLGTASLPSGASLAALCRGAV